MVDDAKYMLDQLEGSSRPSQQVAPESAADDTARLPYRYRISGLQVLSQIALPSAYVLAENSGAADVSIVLDAVPDHLKDASARGSDWELCEKSFLFRVPGVANFLIENAASVRVQPAAGSDPGDITLYLLGTCLAILLQQRGSLVLHASAVAVEDRAMLFCGVSGAGKSTMAALLCQHGCSLLNDDTCNVTYDETGNANVCGDGRMLKLWEESLDHLQLRSQQVAAVRRDTPKFYTAPDVSDFVPRRVAAIYLLEVGDPEERPSIEPLRGLQATIALRKNAYRSALVEAMSQESEFFRASALLQLQAGVYRLRRALDFSQAKDVVALLQAHWAELEIQSRW